MEELFKNLCFVENNNLTDPAFNLALEEVILRRAAPENSYFLLYRNRPSVIIGKHQNVWNEVNLPFCRKHSIPVFRRISGGGTVFHDLGNLNFSFITRHTQKNFNRYRPFVAPIIKVLRQLGLQAKLDANNNLVIGNKKICGTAQFTSRGRLLSHGTLLFNAELDLLYASLHKDEKLTVSSQARKSIHASVGNIASFLKKPLSIGSFSQALLQTVFPNGVQTYSLNSKEREHTLLLAKQKYSRWEWNFAGSPACTILCRTPGHALKLRVENGLIKSLEISSALFTDVKKIEISRMFRGQLFKMKNLLRNLKNAQLTDAQSKWLLKHIVSCC